MSKAIEALEEIKAITKFDGGRDYDLGDKKEFKIIEEALQRLEAIDNSKPSEALECLERIETAFSLNKQNKPSVYNDYLDSIEPYYKDYNTIKQALIKAQEQEKVLEITKEHLTFKDSGIEEYTDILTNKKVKKHCIKIESKDTGATIHIHLDTQEENEILKRWLEDD